jgi:DNA replication protein DnaC
MSVYAGEMVLRENLKTLRLPTILREYDACTRAAKENNSSYIDFLSALTTLEVQERATKRIRRRISEAQFPSLKTIDTFDINKAPTLSSHLVRELVECQFIGEAENVILIGKSGTGKTHFAIALAIEACRRNFKVRFSTACKLVTELLEAREEYRLKQLLERLKRYDLLVLDELGYVPFTKSGAELLFQILAERYERNATIITTNLPFPEWTDVFGDATLTAALLDRITHHCHIVEFNWASVRFQESSQKHIQNPEVVKKQSTKQIKEKEKEVENAKVKKGKETDN